MTKRLLEFLGLRKKTINAKQALKIIMPIPEDEFTTDTFYDRETGKSCTVGLINRKLRKFGDDWERANTNSDGFGIVTLSSEFLQKHHGVINNIMDVNDANSVNGYTEDKPKDRAVHLLEDMVKAGY